MIVAHRLGRDIVDGASPIVTMGDGVPSGGVPPVPPHHHIVADKYFRLVFPYEIELDNEEIILIVSNLL